MDHVLRDLRFIENRRFQRTLAIGVRAFLGEWERDGNGHDEQDGHNKARFVGKFPHEGNFRYKIAVLGPIHQRTEQHQKSRHHNKNRQECKQDRFNETNRHIRADAELHKHHGDQSADGGQAARANLRDCLAQRHNHRLANRKKLVLLLVPVAENDGVVKRQSQLENAGHGIGDEGDLSQQKVRAEIENHRHNKGENQHRYFRVCLRGEQQHDDDDHRHIHHNNADLAVNCLLLGISKLGRYIQIISGESRLDLLQGIKTRIV